MKRLRPMYQLDPATELSADLIKDAIDFNERRRRRFDRLDDYYIGNQPIFQRKKTEAAKNNRVMINHARYITDLFTGYLVGNPVDYQCPNADLEPVLEHYRRQVISNLDAEIAKECSIFGMKYEYVYADEEARPNSVELDVRNTLIAYDNTLQHHKMFGIYYQPIFRDPEDQVPDHFDVLVATPTEIINYTLSGAVLQEKEGGRFSHAFGDVPIIEYRNNGECQGDFENVTSIIDAYNILQSDRVNDREQLVDAILLFYGMEFDTEQMEMLRSQRAISRIPTDGRVEYLTKNVSESEADVLRQTLEQDLHKISTVPNMSDENFAGNSSGVALKYKLFAFELATKNKERFFEKGLLERFKLYANFLQMKNNMAPINIADVDAVFTRNLPSNDLEIAQMINYLTDIVDRETLIAQLSFVKDASAVVEALEGEKEASSPADNYAGNDFGMLGRSVGTTEGATTEDTAEAEAETEPEEADELTDGEEHNG